MITRKWHGKTTPENADRYLKLLLNDGTNEYLKTEGNISVKVWQQEEDECCHFWTVTEWKDISSIKAFAGDNFKKAKYYPHDEGLLLEFEENVEHYATHDLSNRKIRSYIIQLEQLFNGGSWQGESFREKLKHVNDDIAFTQPISGNHCLGEIIWHCIYWRNVLMSRLEGVPDYKEKTVEKNNFLPLSELKQMGWQKLLHQFEDSQRTIIKLLSTKNDNFLDSKFLDECTFEHLVEGIIHHDIYHLGQIGLVLAMLHNTST